MKYSCVEDEGKLVFTCHPICDVRPTEVAVVHELTSENPILELKHPLGFEGVKEILRQAERRKEKA